jgi:hypothetical protein
MERQFHFFCVIDVDDPAALISAARQRAADDAADFDDFAEDYGILYAALFTMFDPGVAPPGCSIIDSGLEELC